jgi:hypothetical protein
LIEGQYFPQICKNQEDHYTGSISNDKSKERQRMGKKLVLFVCVHNSARSQMAQAYLNTIAGDRFDAESAGLEAGTLNPLAVEAMA